MGGSSEKRKRNLSYELLEANRLSKSLFTKEILDEESTLAKVYAETKCDMAVILENEDGDIIAIPYSQRFSPNYARKVKKKLFKDVLPKMKLFKHFLFVTFTVNHTRYVSQNEVKSAVQKAWNKLNTVLKREYPWVKFVRTTEWQDNGMGAHLHVLLCGVRFIPKSWFEKYWIESSGWGIELEQPRGNDAKSVLKYMLKYIAKSSLRYDRHEKLSVSQIVNWATFTRSFSVSRTLCRLGFPKTNSNKNWWFLGVIPWSEIKGKSKSEILEYIFNKEF